VSPKADLNAVAPASVRAGFDAKPAATFPVGIAAVRIQAPSYTNYYVQHNGGIFGGGRYTVITAHEVEEQAQFDRVAALPEVSGLISINRMRRALAEVPESLRQTGVTIEYRTAAIAENQRERTEELRSVPFH
jgi:hypothetical protein